MDSKDTKKKIDLRRITNALEDISDIEIAFETLINDVSNVKKEVDRVYKYARLSLLLTILFASEMVYLAYITMNNLRQN